MDGAGDQTFARARLSREPELVSPVRRMEGRRRPFSRRARRRRIWARTASKVALSPTRSASGSISPLRVSLLLNSLLSFVPLDHCPPPLTTATGWSAS